LFVPWTNSIFWNAVFGEAQAFLVRARAEQATKIDPTIAQRLTMRNPAFRLLLERLALFAVLPLVLFAHRAGAAVTTPGYVQGNYAVPQTPQMKVTLPYTAAQTAGNLNVVIVGWNDSTAHVSSLTDSKGNVYQLAVGPIVTGALSQAIYYARSISSAAAATNSVTVTFSTAAIYPDIRILEYSGIDPVNPLDGVAGAIGNSATSSSSAVTTSSATDLLVGANTTERSTTGPGSGFTQRLLTAPDGDIAEDEIVTVAGSYSATAPIDIAGGWVMQMVAFRAAGSSAPTPTPSPTSQALAYVQGNFAVPQTPQTTVTVPYAAAQKAGDLNVVVVGWNDSTTHLTALFDTNGNTYYLAAGPAVLTSPPGLSQAVLYANNISAATAGSNAVTVSFDAGASYPDIRILEYSGVDPVNSLDVAVGAIGNSATSSSGAVTTTNAMDLLVGANVIGTTSGGPGGGWTQRLLTTDGDIVEDRVVTAVGSYSATAPLTSAGPWMMQMVAFRAAASASGSGSSPSPIQTATPVPTPSPTPTATPVPTPSPTPASSITLAWNADVPTSDPVTNTVGYKLYIGLASGIYTQSTSLGNTTEVILSNLISGTTYYYVVTAYNSAGVESSPSNEVSYSVP
jgi:fibronectin type III domain protein